MPDKQPATKQKPKAKADPVAAAAAQGQIKFDGVPKGFHCAAGKPTRLVIDIPVNTGLDMDNVKRLMGEVCSITIAAKQLDALRDHQKRTEPATASKSKPGTKTPPKDKKAD